MAKKQSKKIIRTNISNRLMQTFGDLEPALGKKKFQRNIKRASKALAARLKGFNTLEVKEESNGVEQSEVVNFTTN